MYMSSKFKNFDTFQSVDNMNPTVRGQQFAFNGRIFIPPMKANGEPFDISNNPNNASNLINFY